MMPMLRADLHVHSCHSRVSGTLSFLGSRDCYSKPADVYRVAKARGMDLVAFTDHDSIGGALELLNDRPDLEDVIVAEEVSCRLPDGGLDVHLGVYGMTEALHRDVQPLRGNAFDVIACLREAGVFFSLNHLLHFYRGQIPLDRYLRLLDEVPALEVRNGAMLAAHNTLLEQIARSGVNHGTRFVAMVAGSDAHTLRRVGTTWTAAPGATCEEFLGNVAAGRGRVGGVHGSTLQLAGDIYGVVVQYWLSLVGLQRHEISVPRRLLGGSFSLVTMPGEFVPLIVAARSKQREAKWVASSSATLGLANGALPAAAHVEPEPGL